MKEITGQIKNWDEASQRGKIEGDRWDVLFVHFGRMDGG